MFVDEMKSNAYHEYQVISNYILKLNDFECWTLYRIYVRIFYSD